jgi:hypothetical protein
LANELLEQTAAPPDFDSTPLPLEGASQAVDNTGDKVRQSVSSNEQVWGVPIGGTSTPRVKSGVGLPFAATVSFRNLQGRVIVVGLFAFAWFMQAVRGMIDHISMTYAAAESLGFWLGFSPLLILFAWLLWLWVLKRERGLFPFSLALVTAIFSAYGLIAGQKW